MARPIHAIRYPLAIDARLGRVAEEHDHDEYVRQLIRQVLLTNPGERINRPDFGAGLRRLVFGPNSPATASLAKSMITQALESTLAQLIRVEDVQTAAQDERLLVAIVYTALQNGERRFLNLEVAL